jgi:predicted esterase
MIRIHPLSVLALALVGPVSLLSCSSDSDTPGAPAEQGGSGGGDTDAQAGGGGDTQDAGAGGSAGGTAGGGGAAGEGGSTGATCDTLQNGMNKGFMVDGLARDFILDLPTGVESGGPWPVVFNWHGLGDTATNMNGLIASAVNSADFPFIGVTPEDSNFPVMGQNFDWEVLAVDAEKNREARLFDEILLCLEKKYKIDPLHIHSMGFSLGSIVTDMLGTVRGDKLASTLTFSGVYFSNPDDTATLGMVKSAVSWPAPKHQNAYAQIILHGGTADTYNLSVVTLHFDAFAQNDTKYLNGLGHDVVVCNHGQGHTAPAPGFTAKQIMEFFKAHPKGTVDSPYVAALPSDFPSYCSFSLKQK